MYYLTDIKGGQLPVADPGASLKVVDAFLSDMEIAIVMHAEEIKYWQDIRRQLLQLQEQENRQ